MIIKKDTLENPDFDEKSKTDKIVIIFCILIIITALTLGYRTYNKMVKAARKEMKILEIQKLKELKYITRDSQAQPMKQNLAIGEYGAGRASFPNVSMDSSVTGVFNSNITDIVN